MATCPYKSDTTTPRQRAPQGAYDVTNSRPRAGFAGYTLPVLSFGVVALGVTDVQRAAEFWSAALGYRLREDGFGGWAKVLVPPDGAGTAIALQLSETPLQSHPRLHFDLHVASVEEQEAEATRLVSLGARRVDWDSYPDDPDFIVLEDPDGNRFCIVDLGHEYR
jgi:catechol 2,3-dioxygenase-like lactoylglutathione lyase family enzyme